MSNINIGNDFTQYPAVIKIIGIGGAGGNAVDRMISSNVKGVEFITANTDAQALRVSKAGLKLQLGLQLTKGLGVGGNPVLGRQAAEADREKIKETLSGADMVFITAGMGGGTGTGATPIIAEIAKELGVLTVAVVTKPFMFEGKVRTDYAEKGIQELKKNVDTLITIPNQKLFGVIDPNTPAHEAWEKIDDVLRRAIQSISDIITNTGIINVDFNDVKAIMTDTNDALMGLGEGSGEGRAIVAADMAISSPLLENVSIEGAKGVLVNITGGKDLTMFEINEAMNLIYDSISENAHVYFGQVFDETMYDKIKVTVIATKFSQDDTCTQNKESAFNKNHPVNDELIKPAFLRIKNKKFR